MKSKEIKHRTIFEHFLTTNSCGRLLEKPTIINNRIPLQLLEKPRRGTIPLSKSCTSCSPLQKLMGLNQKNRVKDYWSTDKLIATPIFGELFARDRYLSILRYLHFADNDTEEESKLRKIQPIVNHLRKKFQAAMIPWETLCVDESLMLWKGRLSFKQYIPTKRRRFGMKLFMLRDCNTKFVLNFVVYTGVETAIDNHPDVGLSGSVVLSSITSHLEKNHTLFVDNWFLSPLLFGRLLEQKTKACGTVSKNRSGMPSFETLAEGQLQAFQITGKLLALKWMDKREVYMLTTLYKPVIVESEKYDRDTGRRIKKPLCIVHYNKNMRAVDQVDMQISFSECLWKTIKWYEKLFFHLLDITVQNSYAMFRMNNENLELSEFRMQLARELIEEYGLKRLQSKGRPPIDFPLRLAARHFIAFIPGNNVQKRCFVCSHIVQREKKRSDTRFYCPSCDVSLCNPNCFRGYHTLKAF